MRRIFLVAALFLLSVLPVEAQDLTCGSLSNPCSFWASPFVSTGSANAQVITSVSGQFQLAVGNTIIFVPGFTNTGATTVNVDSTGVKAVNFAGSPITAGTLIAGVGTQLIYNGTNFDLPVSDVSGGVGSFTDISVSGTATIQNLQLGGTAVTLPIPVVEGGTGATTAVAALSNLLTNPAVGGQTLTCTTASSCQSAPTVNVFGQTNLLDTYPAFFTSGNTAAQNTTQIQTWLDAAYTTYINYSTGEGNYNLTRVSCVKALIPKGSGSIHLDSPIIIPPGICTDFNSMFVRQGNAGTITSNYTGDTTSQALANLYQPMIIYTPGSHNIGRIDAILNSVGTDRGSGVAAGRTWQVLSLTLANGGSGFVGGETCTTKNGDTKSPYSGARFTVASASGGAATAITYTPVHWDNSGNSGVYSFPLLLQQIIWTAANGWTGSRAVFDGSNNYITSCSGSGTGLTVTPVMYPDWCDGTNGCGTSTSYFGLFSNPTPNYAWLGVIHATQSAKTTSATYGYTFGTLISAYDTHGDEIQTGLAQEGMVFTGADVFFNKINDVGSAIGLSLGGGGYSLPSITLDSNTQEYISINQLSNAVLAGRIFTSQTPTITSQSIGLGDTTVSTSNENFNLNMNFAMYNAGSSSGVPAISCAYTRNSQINLTVSNTGKNNFTEPGQNTSFVAFGTDCQASNLFTGTIDNVTGPLYSGTWPQNIGFDVYDAAAPVVPGTYTATIGGTVAGGGGDVLNLTFTNGKITGFPVTVSYTTIGGDTTTTIAAALAAAINANSTLSTNNLIATSATNVISISQAGPWTFNTTTGRTISPGSETISFSNGGIPTGSVNGAQMVGKDLYNIYNSSLPAGQTGVKKAGAGSQFVDTFTGQTFSNYGSTSATSWQASSAFFTPLDTTPGGSVSIGNGSQYGTTGSTARGNTSIGYQTLAGALTTAAVTDTALGFLAGQHVTSGAGNSFFGASSGMGDTTGSNNTGIGLNSCVTITTGSGNVCIGQLAGGTTLATGSNNILIGASADTPSSSTSNYLNIGGFLTGTSAGLTIPYPLSLTSLSASAPVVSTDASKNLTTTAPTQTANTIYAGPTTGAAASPTFRALVGADLPNPSASTLGGVESLAAVSHNFLTSISTAGVPAQAQPAFTDISGTLATGQLPSGVLPILTGTTGSIGGGALLAGACTSGTVGVTNSTTSMSVDASPAGGTDPGDAFYVRGYVSAAGTVTVKVCAAIAGTPTATTYNVRVLQ